MKLEANKDNNNGSIKPKPILNGGLSYEKKLESYALPLEERRKAQA